MGRDGMMNYSMMDWWGMGFGAFFMTVMLIIVIVFSYLLIRRLSSDNSRPAHITPVEILEERFARGEIDENEFRQKRDQLKA